MDKVQVKETLKRWWHYHGLWRDILRTEGNTGTGMSLTVGHLRDTRVDGLGQELSEMAA